MLTYENDVVDCKSSNKNSVIPFGAQYLTSPSKTFGKPVNEWNWVPTNNNIEYILDEIGSFPGTTGTGPDMRGDEFQDEM